MFLIAGLGNYDARYRYNRHNAGFMAVDALAEYYGWNFKFQKKFQGEIAQGEVYHHKLLLLKPHTYMNLSGRSILAVLRFFKLDKEALLVIHDEIDLPFLRLRLSRSGGAGHNGVGSIFQHVGKGFLRLRVGVGRPVRPFPVADYVLGDFIQDEQNALDGLYKEMVSEMIWDEKKCADFCHRINAIHKANNPADDKG